MRLQRLLLPLNPLYRVGLLWRERRLRTGLEPLQRLNFPVISIGNLSTGGAGKTPFVVTLARGLRGRGFAVDVLSRGYGRHSSAASRVRLRGTADEFGDEPLLIAHDALVPVYVARRRYEAGVLAEAYAEQKAPDQHPHVHILDDGFQHRQLHRDVDILLLSREDWKDHLLPGGNLREPRHAIRRADVICIPSEEPGLENELRAWGWKGPVWRLRRHMDIPVVEGRVVAFCGIARPGQFFAGLEAAGLKLARRIAFEDHYRYAAVDLDQLERAARAAGARALITTAKDRVRLAGLGGSHPLLAGENDSRSPVLLPLNAKGIGHGDAVGSVAGPGAGPAQRGLSLLTAGLRVAIEDEAAALDWIAARLEGTGRGSPV
jgi:tetraacyldisaccharide 4'-kinase